MKRFFLLPTFVFLLGSLNPAGAQVLNYWSFNGESLAPNIGGGSAVVTAEGLGIGWTSFNTGTTVNLVSPFPAGESISDIDVATAFNWFDITLSSLDFTGRSGVGFSFATRSTALFTLGESMHVDYDLGSGWVEAQEVTLPDSIWSSRTVDFGNLLDNQADVKIRLRLDAFVDVAEVIEVDNVQVVPEPSTQLLMAMGFAVVGLIVMRGTRKARPVTHRNR